MTQPEKQIDQSQATQIAQAKDLIIEALALLDHAGVSLPAIYLDRALSALGDEFAGGMNG